MATAVDRIIVRFQLCSFDIETRLGARKMRKNTLNRHRHDQVETNLMVVVTNIDPFGNLFSASLSCGYRFPEM